MKKIIKTIKNILKVGLFIFMLMLLVGEYETLSIKIIILKLIALVYFGIVVYKNKR